MSSLDRQPCYLRFSIRSSLYSNLPPQASPSSTNGMRNTPTHLTTRPPANPSTSTRSSLLHSDTSQSLFEQQNNSLADALHSKVAQLKQLSIAIGDEVSHQNRMLGELDEEMAGAGSGMKGVVGRLGGMLSGGGSKHMCWLVAFICAIFFIVYWLKR